MNLCSIAKEDTNNLYTYCKGNPVSYYDQSGNGPELVLWLFVPGVGEAVVITTLAVATGITIAYGVHEAIQYANNSSKKSNESGSPSNWQSWKDSGNKWWNPKPNKVKAKVYISTKALEEI